MKSLLIAISITSLSFGDSVTWTPAHSEVVEQTTLALTPKLREQTVIIGRLGLAETYVATVIDKEGHLISPFLPSPDGEPLPYILYRPDGSRSELKTIEEKPKRFLALLKYEDGFPDASPLQISALDQHTVVVPSCAPIASKGEEASLIVDHLPFSPAKDSSVFNIELPVHFPGSSIFDISGNLIGFVVGPDQNSTKALTVTKAATEFPKFGELLPDPTPANQPSLPSAPSLTREEKKELFLGEITEARFAAGVDSLPSPLPCVLIFNEGTPLTNSTIGTIVRPDGIILTKASELGPSLSVRYAGQNYPGLLLATDEETDLALVSINASNMPVVRWHEELPPSGSTTYAPILLKENSEEMIAEERTYFGTFSHLLKAKTSTLHATSQVTTLGLYTEQTSSTLTIAALAKDTPAYESGLSPGDILISIDNTPLENRADLNVVLESKSVGDEVTVKVNRGDAPMEFKVKLSAPHLTPPATGINNVTGLAMIPSVWRGPFPDVLVHTTPLNSWDCGSPLFTRKGQALGINIAAVSPGRSYALLPKDIKAAMTRMLSNSRPF
ncbi:MAG: PDZ domain-containing protein [Akkermansiaceae bacterium]